MATKIDINRALLENFILYLTHCGDEKDNGFTEPQTYTPEDLYRVIYDYLEEDHVDGKGNPENLVEIKEPHPIEVGKKIIDLFNLKSNKKDLYPTSWGNKNIEGVGQSVINLIKS